MNDILGLDSALLAYTGPGTTWTNGMNYVMNDEPGALSIVRPVDHPAVQRGTSEPRTPSVLYIFTLNIR